MCLYLPSHTRRERRHGVPETILLPGEALRSCAGELGARGVGMGNLRGMGLRRLASHAKRKREPIL